MRYIFFALAFVALACSKAKPPTEPEVSVVTKAAPAPAPEPEAPPTPKAGPPAALAPESTPTVTLLDAGKPPLQALRRSFKKGQKETMSFEVGETITMKGGSGTWDTLFTPLVLLQSIDVETVAVSKDGVADVTLEVRDAKELEGSVAKPNTKQMNPTGVTGRYKINTEGVVTELTLDPPPKSLKVQKSFLDSLRSKLRSIAPPFPKEPVGIGAKWTVAAEVNEFLAHMQEQVTVELVERTDSEIVLRFEIKSTGAIHHDFTPPQDVTVDIKAHGEATLDPSKVVPSSSELAQQIVQTATIEGADAPDAPTVQTLTYTVKVQSK